MQPPENAPQDTYQTIDQPEPPQLPTSSGWRQKLKLHWPPGKKEWLVAAAVLIFIAALGAFFATRDAKNAVVIEPIKKTQPQKSKTVASQLSGLQVDPSANNRPVTGIMIENSPDARPQSGLSQASVVFEAIAEGGITRFLALFQDTAPDDIGPVRSARPYYVQWNQSFDAAYAHVGGSPDAIADIKAWGVRDLDQFYNSGAYRRVGNRAAPHNVYTSIAALNQLEAAKGYATSTFDSIPRKKATPSKAPTAKTIDLGLSGPTYNVHYDYVPATNSYNRSEGGAPHMDANGNVQISPSVVVALVIPYSLAADGHHSEYASLGSGQAFIFQDGKVTIGQWTKTAVRSQITFADAAGKTLRLNPGQTWLTAVASTGQVGYQP